MAIALLSFFHPDADLAPSGLADQEQQTLPTQGDDTG
jgi:hypothetical protein